MQYSRVAFVLMVSAGILVLAGYGQQRPSPESDKRLSIMCEHAAPPAGTHWVCNDRKDPCNCKLESNRPGGSLLDEDSEPQLPVGKVSAAGFEQIMNALAAARKEGNAAKVSELLTGNAIYSNLATGETRKGQAAVARLLGSGKTSVKATSIQWHHLLFNEKEQIGAGEFSLEGTPRHHGMVIVKLENGKISNCREYRLASSRSWEKITAENQF